jgi:hypothetical protein
MTNEEILRTLGMLLDICGCDTAVLVLTPGGAEVTARGWRYDQHWSLEALQRESAIQRGCRLLKPADGWPVEGLRWCLRPIGAYLDAAGPGKYVLTVKPHAVRVQGKAGLEQTFDAPALKRLAVQAVCRRARWPLQTGAAS